MIADYRALSLDSEVEEIAFLLEEVSLCNPKLAISSVQNKPAALTEVADTSRLLPISPSSTSGESTLVRDSSQGPTERPRTGASSQTSSYTTFLSRKPQPWTTTWNIS